MTRQEVVNLYGEQVEELVGRVYSRGYDNGYADGTEKIQKLRSECVREAGENDDKYPDEWDDHTPFYGWCNLCKRPHSGRWAHVWEYCPWCGARIKHDLKNEPYYVGEEHETKRTNKQNKDIRR